MKRAILSALTFALANCTIVETKTTTTAPDGTVTVAESKTQNADPAALGLATAAFNAATAGRTPVHPAK